MSASGDQAVPHFLSRAELRVVRLLPYGLTHAAMGRRLDLEECTVQSHLCHIRRRWGVSSTAQVLAVAYRHGIIPPPDSPGLREAQRFMVDVARELGIVHLVTGDLSGPDHALVLLTLRERLERLASTVGSYRLAGGAGG